MEQTLLFRKVAITTTYEQFFPVLLEYGSDEQKTRGELCTTLGLSSGQTSRILHDGRLLKLWNQQLHLLEMGRKWRSELRLYRKVRPETIQEAARNVELFRLTLEQCPTLADPERIYQQFLQVIGTSARPQEVGSARRRYLEAFFPPSSALPSKTSAALVQVGDPTLLPRFCQLSAKYAQLRQEFSREEIAAVCAYESQIKER